MPISSVVLSGQRVNTCDALYNASHGKKQTENDAKNPLVQEGLKLIPSVTRVFNTSRKMYVYLQAYAGGAPAGTTEPAAVPEAGSRLGVTPFSFHLGLGYLAAGRYECQISVLDPAGRRVAFWVNPVMLVK